MEYRLNVRLSGGFILAVMHPVTEEASKADEQAEMFVHALNKVNYPKIVILPNNDAGSNLVKDAILKEKKGKYYLYSNLKREDYLGLLKESICIVGNSSSGLLEAPTFKIPAVNIGRRQNLRLRGVNVIDTEFDEPQIDAAIKKAMSIEFRKFLSDQCVNPYGDGHSSERILDLLINTKVDEKWIVKNLTY